MLKRKIANILYKALNEYQVISITGPRQSGKTTLTKDIFTEFAYFNLERVRDRNFAQEDPEAFLNQSKNIIIDEVQNVPELLSDIQVLVDEDPKRKFIITGSQNLLISEQISQSLAGRVSINTLLPFSLDELKNNNLLAENLNEQIIKGFYPKIYDKKLNHIKWYENYTSTYIERDVRKIKNIGSLSLFRKFMSLLAGRTGQVLNISSLANDTGVSVNTAESWISILEASYICFRLQPYYKNYDKRVTKSPKIHFYDSGLVCSLIGITTAEQVQTHPLVGSIFESFVISDFIKRKTNISKNQQFYYWRENHGKEIDLIYEEDGKKHIIEIKYGQTPNISMANNLIAFKKLVNEDVELNVLYGGDESQKRTEFSFISWKDMK